MRKSRNFMRTAAALGIAVLTSTLAAPATAHEFWLEARNWVATPGDTVQFDMFNGVEMKGSAYPWIDRRTVRAEVITPAGVTPYDGRDGDLPAVEIAAAEPGLNVLLFESAVTSLTYADFALFREFTEEKALDAALEEHLREGLPQNGLREIYTRHTKALFAVGDGAGQDVWRGMDHELVAETNPYTLAEGEPMQVRLLRDGNAVADARVTVFRRDADGDVTLDLLETDTDGRVRFALVPGSSYLVDNVHLRRTTRSEVVENAAFWASSWAALTFGRP